MSQYIGAVGLLTLTVGANFTGDLLGCGIKKTLTEQPLAKHGLAYLLLIFFAVLSNKDAFIDNTEAGGYLTLTILWKSLLAYLAFIAFTKCHLAVGAIVLVLLLAILFLDFEKTNKSDETIAALDEAKKYITWAAVGLLAVGTGVYAYKQWKEHGSDFKPYKFLLGSTKCEWQYAPLPSSSELQSR